MTADGRGVRLASDPNALGRNEAAYAARDVHEAVCDLVERGCSRAMIVSYLAGWARGVAHTVGFLIEQGPPPAVGVIAMARMTTIMAAFEAAPKWPADAMKEGARKFWREYEDAAEPDVSEKEADAFLASLSLSAGRTIDA